MPANIDVGFFLDRAYDERRRAARAPTPALADLHEQLSALYVGLAEARAGAVSAREGCVK